MIIDRSVVITGNFNFAKKAKQKNVENLLVVRAASTVIIAGLKRESAQLGINSPRRGSAIFYQVTACTSQGLPLAVTASFNYKDALAAIDKIEDFSMKAA